MRIWQFLPDHRMGGMQEVAYVLDRGLKRDDFEMTLSTLKSEDAGERSAGSLGRVRQWVALAIALRRESTDAVMAHAPKTAVFTATAAWLARVPRRVMVMHTARVSLSRPDRLALYVLGALGLVTEVVCVGEAVARGFEPAPKSFTRRMRVIRNGMPLGATAGGSPGSSDEDQRFHALVVGRLVSSKNVALAIRACARAGADVRLTVVGDGPEREALTRLASSSAAAVTFRGRQDRAAVTDLYSGADVLLFPTRTEGLPLVLLEAAQAGLPVIASDIPPNREVLGDDALYCPVDDLDALGAGDRAPVERRRSSATPAARQCEPVEGVRGRGDDLGLRLAVQGRRRVRGVGLPADATARSAGHTVRVGEGAALLAVAAIMPFKGELYVTLAALFAILLVIASRGLRGVPLVIPLPALLVVVWCGLSVGWTLLPYSTVVAAVQLGVLTLIGISVAAGRDLAQLIEVFSWACAALLLISWTTALVLPSVGRTQGSYEAGTLGGRLRPPQSAGLLRDLGGPHLRGAPLPCAGEPPRPGPICCCWAWRWRPSTRLRAVRRGS